MSREPLESYLDAEERANQLVDALESLKHELEEQQEISRALNEIASSNQESAKVLAEVADETRSLIKKTNEAGIAGLMKKQEEFASALAMLNTEVTSNSEAQLAQTDRLEQRIGLLLKISAVSTALVLAVVLWLIVFNGA